jgi:NhaA family Na+:H+ antiporter
VVFLVVPVFGFANAGVALGGVGLQQLLDPVSLGVALGLFAGKQIGVVLLSLLAIKMGVARLPAGSNWLQLYGIALLCGIGFTMSLFIGGLAFPGRPDLVEQAKIGTLAGSFLSALAGYALLRFAPRPSAPPPPIVPDQDEADASL